MITLRIRDILQRVFFKPQAAAPTQATGVPDLYVKTDKSLYYRDVDGAETSISGATVTSAPTFNATTSFTLNGTNINDSNTLDNIAYLDYANAFTAANTFAATNVFSANQNMNGYAITGEVGLNDTWDQAKDKNGTATNLFKLNTSTELDFGVPVNIASLLLPVDSVVTIADTGLTAGGNYGDEAGAKIWVGGEQMIFARVENDGTGGVVDGSDYVILKGLYVSDEHTDQATVTGDTTFTDVVPKGYLLKYLIAEETAGNAATLDLGTTAGASDVFLNEVFAASTITTVVINKLFSFTDAQSLFLNDDDAGSSWNSGSLNVYFVLEKITE